MRAPPLAPNFFIFMQFSGKIGQIIGWRPLPLGLAPPPLGNPGSATERGIKVGDSCESTYVCSSIHKMPARPFLASLPFVNFWQQYLWILTFCMKKISWLSPFSKEELQSSIQWSKTLIVSSIQGNSTQQRPNPLHPAHPETIGQCGTMYVDGVEIHHNSAGQTQSETQSRDGLVTAISASCPQFT